MKKEETVPTVEVQAAELILRVAMTKRLGELKDSMVKIQESLRNFEAGILQQTAQANATAGAIGEIENLLNPMPAMEDVKAEKK